MATRARLQVGVARDAVDFIRGEVVFPRPPAPDEWSAFPGPAPLF